MSREKFNNQQYNTTGNYQDPLAAPDGKKPAKKAGGAAIGSTVVAVIIMGLFGVVGGLICYGGFWAVYAICKSRLPLVVKIILSIVVGLIFLALLLIFILAASTLVD